MAVTELLDNWYIQRMDWPTRFPDLNLIELVWDTLGHSPTKKLTTSLSAWIDDTNPAAHTGVSISPNKNCIFLSSHPPMDVSIFCPVVLETTFSIKFHLHLLVSFYRSSVHFVHVHTSCRCLIQFMCIWGPFHDVTLRKKSPL